MSKKVNLLIKQSKKSNQKAQMQLYDLYCEAMFTISCRYLSNVDEAKDAMQEGFLKAFLKLENYDFSSSFGAWLKRIIINQCIDTLKKKKLETISFEKNHFEIVEDDSWEFEVAITREMILRAIEMLSDKYKLVVKLYLLEGYSHSEISKILVIPIKTSRTHLRRGKLQLQELLKKERYEARY